MARREVDLIIRAKDEAEKVLNKITGALEEFRDASAGVDSSAAKNESSLGRLGAAISTLEKNLGGLQIADKLDSELGKAAKVLTKLDDKFDKTKAEAADFQKQLARTGDQADRFKSKLNGATDALARQRTSIKTAKENQKELANSYSQAERAQEKLSARQEKLPALIERQSVALVKARGRYADLADTIERTVAPSRTLQGQFEASTRNVDQAATKLAKLTTEYGEIGGKIRAAGSAMVIFSGQAEKTATSVAKQEVALSKIEDNLTGLKGASRAASTEQGKLEGHVRSTTDSLNAQRQSIEQAEGNYVTLAQAAGKADAALEELATQSLGRLSKDLKDQRLAALRAKKGYADLTAETSRLATNMRNVIQPTKAMKAEFEASKISAAAAKKEYLAQRQALELMGRAYRDTKTDLTSINATQTRFQKILRETTEALRANAAAAAKNRAELGKVGSSSTSAAGGMSRLAAASARSAAANSRNAGSLTQAAAALRRNNGDTRRSLGLTQRLRGEVLSLVAAYGGLYGVISVLRGTVEAYQSLEAAQSRLTVATGGNQDAATQELDFLRRTADRLGLSFGVLSQEYSKFAIATQGTNLEGANTRKIFLSVAEAARVNRSSTKEMAGVFVALTQIVSKGAVQMEELRQQLGDRLPGAIKIMADGLGVGTAELIKMMEQGEVTADALVPFADELNKKFGKGLPDALNSVSSSLGRLANEAFEALLRFGSAGFLDSFQNFADTLTTTLKSADFQAFSARASRALGTVVDLLGFLAANFKIVVVSITAFLALRLTPVFVALAQSMNVTSVMATKTGASFAVLQARAAGMGVSVSRAAFALRGLRVAFTALLASSGIGLLVAAVSVGISLWATSADEATDSLVTHLDILDKVKNAYESIGDSVEVWKNQLDTLTRTEATENLKRVTEALGDTQDALDLLSKGNDRLLTNFFGYNLTAGQEIFNVSDKYKAAVQQVIGQFRRGEIESDKLVSSLDAVNTRYVDGSNEARKFGLALIAMARKELEVTAAHKNATDVLLARAGSADVAQAAFDRLGGKITEVIDPTEEFGDAFEKLAAASAELVDNVPKSTSKIEEAAEQAAKLATAYQDALKAARELPDAIQRAAAEQKVFQSYAEGMAAALSTAESSIAKAFDQYTTGSEAAAAFIREKEGFRSSSYFDVNAERVGFGSDTTTDEAGIVRAVVAGTVTSIEAANRDLTRRLTQEFIPAVRNAIGAERFDALTAQQQASLVSLAYNYGAAAFNPGESLSGIADQVRNGTKEGVVAAIAARAGDNDGVNRGRRLEEAALFNTDSGTSFAIAEIEKRNEAEVDFHNELRDENETRRQEAALQSASLIKQEQGKAIREAELEAKREGTQLTQDEIQAINETVAAKFAAKQEEQGITDAKEKAALADAKVNALLAQRRALDKRLDIAQEQGDTSKASELETKLISVNDQLTKAIESAKLMWAAIGGDAATNAIIKLETAGLRAETLEGNAQKTYLQWDRVGDLFVNGLASAFDTFTQKVAEGESVGKAASAAFLQFASDFLLQIAQMIIQQAIFNALSSAFGGTSFGSLLGIGVGHTGGLVGSARVGSGNGTRQVSPAMFSNAARHHSGGVIGLRPSEVPIIAEKGEEMLTRDDPRHMLNGGGQSGSAPAKEGMTIINSFDAEDVLERALSSPRGQQVLVNTIRGTRTEVKAALG